MPMPAATERTVAIHCAGLPPLPPAERVAMLSAGPGYGPPVIGGYGGTPITDPNDPLTRSVLAGIDRDPLARPRQASGSRASAMDWIGPPARPQAQTAVPPPARPTAHPRPVMDLTGLSPELRAMAENMGPWVRRMSRGVS